MLRSALAVAVVVMVAGCQDDGSSRSDLPEPVAEMRAAILDAAEERDYDALRPLIKRDRFLSDYGFGRSGPDPVAQWRKLGDKPLATMEVVLQMRHQVRETGEGTLYQWPRFDANTEPEEITDDERRQLRKVLTEAEYREATVPDYGYTGPEVGILANGTWWFFTTRREP